MLLGSIPNFLVEALARGHVGPDEEMPGMEDIQLTYQCKSG